MNPTRPTRYTCTQDDNGWELGAARMEEVEDGDYVKYDAYLSLEAQNAALREQINYYEDRYNYGFRTD